MNVNDARKLQLANQQIDISEVISKIEKDIEKEASNGSSELRSFFNKYF